MKNKYTKENLEEVAKISFSFRQMLHNLNLKESGGNYVTIQKRCKEFDIDVQHFYGKLWSKGKILLFDRDINDYLSNKVRIKTSVLKHYLFELNLKKRVCEVCCNDKWLGNNIPLELHHVDGNNKNNNLKNLQVLCPNCHALTHNYKRKKK